MANYTTNKSPKDLGIFLQPYYTTTYTATTNYTTTAKEIVWAYGDYYTYSTKQRNALMHIGEKSAYGKN